MLSFKPTFSLSSFNFIKRLFSSSSLSAIRVVSSVYLRLLIFLPAILIPACASPRPAFSMIYSAYKLNKQGDNIQLWRIPLPIWNQSVAPCPVLPVASWPAFKCNVYIFIHSFHLTSIWQLPCRRHKTAFLKGNQQPSHWQLPQYYLAPSQRCAMWFATPFFLKHSPLLGSGNQSPGFSSSPPARAQSLSGRPLPFQATRNC